MNAPLKIKATPQTQSWFTRKLISRAEGIPNTKPTIAIIPIARFLVNPKSMKVLVESSTIEINEVKAAKNRPRKKIEAKNRKWTKARYTLN